MGSFFYFILFRYEAMTQEHYCLVLEFIILQPEEATVIEMQEPVSLTFPLRYMNSLTKPTPLANQVTISMSSELPVVVEYEVAEMDYIY